MKETCEMLAQSRSNRDRAMKELHNVHSKDRMERRATIKRTAGDVKHLFSDVHVLIQHFHADRGKMSKEMQEMLGTFFENTRKETQGILKEARSFLRGFRGEQRKMAEELHQMLEGYAQRIHRDTNRFMKEFHSQFEATCEKEGEERKTFFNGIRRQVGGIRRDVGQMRKGFQEAQKALHTDFQKAQAFWKEFDGGMRQPKAILKAKVSGLQARIMSTLKGSREGMTLKELSYAMGMPEKSLNRVLSRMRRERHLRKRKSTFFAR
ncbi:MAG: hypothetical protein HYS41_04865 [Candidatus Omnitrophica bacterium]|nr:hypothetical protein [Candidatus Omnitrophota bacterium]